MMKKLLSFLMIGTCAVIAAQNANAQSGGSACTPDPQFAGDPGIYPDSAMGYLPNACSNQAYAQTITVVLPTDTLVDFPGVGLITLTMNSIKVDSAKIIMDGIGGIDTSGVPSDINFSFDCSPSNCTFPGGQSGCLQLNGNPTTEDEGVWPLIVYVTANVTHSLLGTFDAPQSIIANYIITIENCGAVETLNTSKFEVGQNIPNPANGSTTINFTSPTPSTVDFKVYNMLGMVVKNNKIDAVSGLNKVNFNTNELAQGVYVYSITNGNTTITKRMVVAGK